VTEQAAMIAYNNDFRLMMMLSLAAIPVVFLLRKGATSAKPVHIE
jgi:DHA2 family multidrug resistance protein